MVVERKKKLPEMYPMQEMNDGIETLDYSMAKGTSRTMLKVSVVGTSLCYVNSVVFVVVVVL